MGSLKVDYVLPTNADESQRLDYQHKLLTRTFGLHRAPLRQDKLRRVLDVGCGKSSTWRTLQGVSFAVTISPQR